MPARRPDGNPAKGPDPGSRLGTEHGDKVRGMLLGGACGDGLGAPFEGMRRVSASSLARWESSSEVLVHTDDTVLSIAVAEELVDLLAAGQPYSEGALLRRLAWAWHAEPDRGYGGGIGRVFTACLAGVPWQRAAEASFGPRGSWGNGAAMRVAPVAAAAGTLAATTRLAARTARVTHTHPLGIDGAVLQAIAVAQALASDPAESLDATRFLAVLHPYLATAEFSHALVRIQGFLGGADPPPHPRVLAAALGNTVTAPKSVPTALAAFLLHPDDPATAIRYAILGGGDTDTIAAMTGALAGARCGEGRLPPTWLQRLEARDTLTDLADDLAARTSQARAPLLPPANPAANPVRVDHDIR